MKWKIAEAKKSFSELIHSSCKEPQVIYNRDVMVAAVINSEEFKEYQEFIKNKERESIASVFKELQSICSEEKYTIVVPKRSNRELQWP